MVSSLKPLLLLCFLARIGSSLESIQNHSQAQGQPTSTPPCSYLTKNHHFILINSSSSPSPSFLIYNSKIYKNSHGLSSHHTRFNPKRPHSLSYLSALLLLAGDIESNPGPVACPPKKNTHAVLAIASVGRMCMPLSAKNAKYGTTANVSP